MIRSFSARCGGAALAALIALAPFLTVEAAAAEEAATVIVITPSAAPAATESATEENDGITVRVSRGAAGLEVEGRCLVRASVPAAWEVLTDYDGIAGFVSSMQESRVTGRGDHHVLVEQVAVGRLFLFRRRFRVTLFVEETPQSSIRFEDVLGRDFELYRGEWRLEDRGGRVELVYRVTARPAFSVPDFVARGLFRRTAHDLLSQVTLEIERRAGPRAAAATGNSPGASDSRKEEP